MKDHRPLLSPELPSCEQMSESCKEKIKEFSTHNKSVKRRNLHYLHIKEWINVQYWDSWTSKISDTVLVHDATPLILTEINKWTFTQRETNRIKPWCIATVENLKRYLCSAIGRPRRGRYCLGILAWKCKQWFGWVQLASSHIELKKKISTVHLLLLRANCIHKSV